MATMPKHRGQTKTFERTACSIIAGAFGTTALMLYQHATEAASPVENTACTIVANYPSPIPQEDIIPVTIQRALRISADQLSLVKGYAATCYTPLAPEQFSQGLPRNPEVFNTMLNTSYDRCAVYGVAKQLIPAVKDEIAPAVLVCIDLPNEDRGNLQQI